MADNLNQPWLSVLVPVWVLVKVTLTRDTGWPVSASRTFPLILVRCAKQQTDTKRQAQHNKYFRLNNIKVPTDLNKSKKL
ncbi:MAG: hypothetical protein V4560_11285 [Bacteroidota bacterium]